jgi:hypothetical protein
LFRIVFSASIAEAKVFTTRRAERPPVYGAANTSGCDVTRPEAYPVEELVRPYDKLFNRLDTPLGRSPRGIAYRYGRVHAIQVGFAPDSPYPDRLLPNGRILHIGEGRGPVQTATGGNAGMLDAERVEYPIPVYQSLGSKGNKKYAFLGNYVVTSHRMRHLKLPGDSHETRVFVFDRKPTKLIR